MRRIGVWTVLAFAAPVLFGGCGTVLGNIGGLPLSENHYMEPYGGVKICLEGGTQSLKDLFDPAATDKGISVFAAAYMLGVDLPLSAVADTITLPLTIRAVLNGEARTGPVQWGGRSRIEVSIPGIPLAPQNEPTPKAEIPQQ